MPPFVVCNSLGVPPPFSRPSRRRRDCSDTSSFTPETEILPLVHEAETSAFAESGTVSVTPPLTVRIVMRSAPSDASSMFTPPLVARASTPPPRFRPTTPPFVVCATILPVRPVSEICPLVFVVSMRAFFGTLT